MPLPVKNICLCIALLLLSLSAAQAQVCHTFEPGQFTHDPMYKTQSADSIGLAPTDNYDIIYHRVALKLDPAVRYIQGSVTSYFRPRLPLTQLSFDLTDSLTVDSVYHAGARLTSFTHSGNALTISFPSAITSLDSVVVYYGGRPPETGFGSFVTTMHDTTHPVLWTLSEPYGARDWWPCKMTLTDKIDSLDTYISVPVGNRAASNGLLTDSSVAGSMVTYHWRHRYPIATYLFGIGVTDYTAHSFTVNTVYGDIDVLDYAFPENEAEWEQSDVNVGKALQLYSDLFGSYPFIKEKYGHAQFGWGGGMEHQTMSFMYNLSFELVNHEMGHQWFGDKLTTGSWSEIWLNEGFATYLAGLCYEHIAPEYWMAWKQSNLTKVIRGENGTVLCDDTTSVGRIFDGNLSYAKGAYLLHMMRGQIGDLNFFSALRSYVSDTALTYNFSHTQKLKAHFEAASGQDLTTFFDQWYYNGGYPSYSLDWSQKASTLSLKLSQASSNPAGNFFTMPVPVKFIGRNIDTTLVLNNTSSGQEYIYQVPFAVDSVIIDPELWLVSDRNSVRRLPVPNGENFIAVLTNPVISDLTIWYDSQNLHQVKVDIYNMDGQKLLSQNVATGTGDYYSTSLSFLPIGVYVARISTEKGTHTQRIAKL